MTTPRILFSHIPKTGGTTLLSHFRGQFGEDAMCVLGPHNRCKRFFANTLQVEEMNQSQRAGYRVVQGHGVNDSSIDLMQDPQMRLMVVLREPVGLVRSRYNQRFSAAKRKDLEVTPEIFMNKNANNNTAHLVVKAFPALMDPGATTLLDQASSILRKFNYVFTTENMGAQLSPMLRAYGLSEKIERKRVAEHKEPFPFSDADIKAANEVDQQLYDIFARPITSDGHSHNAGGFDAAGNKAVFDSILQNHKRSAADWQQYCYDALADALCRELRGAAALTLLDAGKAPIADPTTFKAILEAQWAQKEENLSVEGKQRAKHLVNLLVRKMKKNAL